MGSYVSSSCRAFSFSFIGRTMSKGGPHWFQETNGEWYMARLMSRDCGEVCFNCSETKRVTGWPPWPMPCEMGTGHGGQHYCRWCDRDSRRSGGARAAAAAPKRAAAPGFSSSHEQLRDHRSDHLGDDGHRSISADASSSISSSSSHEHREHGHRSISSSHEQLSADANSSSSCS